MTGRPTHALGGPARDARFDVRLSWSDMDNLPRDHPEVNQEFLHRQMNEEIEGLEIAARNLVDFPEADWELRMEIASQCADEARHAQAFRRLFEARGGVPGQYPVLNFQFKIITSIPSLLGRLAVANRSFEASGLDAIGDGIASSARRDDQEFIALFEQQLADELQHVRYANVWVKKFIDRDGGRAVMEIARAMAHAETHFAAITGSGLTLYPISEGLRREAGFTDEEIHWAQTNAERLSHAGGA